MRPASDLDPRRLPRPRTPASRESLAIFGAGWVGLVTAVGFAELGYRVTVRDVVASRIAQLRNGVIPIHEPGLSELLRRNIDRLTFTLDVEEALAEARVAFVCVGTPSTPSGDADLSAIWRLVDELVQTSPDELTLVMKSTVPVGTGELVAAELARLRAPIAYVANPEFLAEGTAITDFSAPSRIVIGSFGGSGADGIERLYRHFPAPILHTDVPSAEMIKYASNAFLATKISFINEIANVCEETGADVDVVADGMGLDERIGPHFLRAGVGYGGSCFPKDVAALKQLAGNSGYHFELLNAVIEVNELQKRRVLTKLKWHLGSLRTRRIALLGLAFKPNTDDLREAASLVLASRLLAEGARVRAWDPVALAGARPLLGEEVELCEELLEAVDGADAAVVVTEWPEVVQAPLSAIRTAMRFPLIVDGRNALDPAAVRAAGFAYDAIGRPRESSTLVEPADHWRTSQRRRLEAV